MAVAYKMDVSKNNTQNEISNSLKIPITMPMVAEKIAAKEMVYKNHAGKLILVIFLNTVIKKSKNKEFTKKSNIEIKTPDQSCATCCEYKTKVVLIRAR